MRAGGAADPGYHSQPGRPAAEAVRLETKGLELGEKKKGTRHIGGHRKDLGCLQCGKFPQESRPRAGNSSLGRMLAQNLQSPMLYLRINCVWWQENPRVQDRPQLH